MQRYVWVEIDVPAAQPAGAVLQDRLAALEPRIVPYGGVRRRIRLTIDTADALVAAAVTGRLRVFGDDIADYVLSTFAEDEISDCWTTHPGLGVLAQWTDEFLGNP